jgi:hypothetical protein
MKPCPQCGAPLHFAANRWIHAVPAHCLLITLLATPEEMAQHRAAPHLPGARYRKGTEAHAGEWKFGYLAQGGEGGAD